MPPPSRPCKSLMILHEKPRSSILHFRDHRLHQGRPAEDVSVSPKRPESQACARPVADWTVQGPGCGIALGSVLPAYPVGNPSACWKFPALRRVDDQFSTNSVDKPTAAGILREPHNATDRPRSGRRIQQGGRGIDQPPIRQRGRRMHRQKHADRHPRPVRTSRSFPGPWGKGGASLRRSHVSSAATGKLPSTVPRATLQASETDAKAD